MLVTRAQFAAVLAVWTGTSAAGHAALWAAWLLARGRNASLAAFVVALGVGTAIIGCWLLLSPEAARRRA